MVQAASFYLWWRIGGTGLLQSQEGECESSCFGTNVIHFPPSVPPECLFLNQSPVHIALSSPLFYPDPILQDLVQNPVIS